MYLAGNIIPHVSKSAHNLVLGLRGFRGIWKANMNPATGPIHGVHSSATALQTVTTLSNWYGDIRLCILSDPRVECRFPLTLESHKDGRSMPVSSPH